MLSFAVTQPVAGSSASGREVDRLVVVLAPSLAADVGNIQYGVGSNRLLDAHAVLDS